jgi:hypothetical protein
MYLPTAILLPFLILLSGIFLKNKKVKIDGLKTLAATGSFLILFFLISLSFSGNALHVTGVERGFFTSQLLDCYPFLPASFINIDFGAQLIQRFFGLDYSRVMLYLKIINPVILVSLFFFLFWFLFKHKKSRDFSNHFLFITIGSLIGVTIILLLAWLTLTYKELSWGFHTWTFVHENRYFAFIYVIVPVLFFVALQHYGSSFKKHIPRFFVFVVLCCFGIEVTHGIYYNSKILLSHKDLAPIRESGNGVNRFPFILTEIKQQNPDREVLVCSKDQFYLHIASQMGYKAIFDYDNFLQADLKVSKKSILVMPVNTENLLIINEYIEKKNPRLIYTIAGVSFYVQEIDP